MKVKEYMNINKYHYFRIISYRLVKGDLSKETLILKVGDLNLYKDKKGMHYVLMKCHSLYNYIIRVYLAFY